ncbi:MAG TPA: N-acetylmuramoyl-L-alanine amidase [Solirubrobacterales bacterium]|nr:N-acetylmuramoyl-L-alanine amidase [Solirubrobacterales bacterium]
MFSEVMAGRLRFLLLAAVCGALVWGVAPALSLSPYAPGAVDFTQPVPEVVELEGPGSAPPQARSAADSHGGDGPVRFVSPVIEAPARFDLVGIAGEMRPLEYRARLEGGEWSAWIETEFGDPVYFGGADELQVRSRGARPTGELHYVNVSGTQSFADTVLTRVRAAVNAAFVSVAGTAIADAQPDAPEIVTREQWGANLAEGGCPPRSAPSYGEVDAAVVHHTVSANDYTPEEAPSIVLGICRFHRNGNGWNDIGYNFLIDRFGTIYEGRAGGVGAAVVGAQAQGYNSQTFGAASIGTHIVEGVTEAAKEAFAHLIAWKLALHGTIAAGKTQLISGGGPSNKYPAGKKIRVRRVFGHGRVGLTACPGAALKHQIKDIRHRAQALIDQHPAPPPVP